MAFHTPGGGEIQLLAYRRYLRAAGVEVTLMDPWDPRFAEHDLVHFFSCMSGSAPLCGFVKSLGMPLVVSSSLWITPDTKDAYPFAEIARQLKHADAVVTNSDMESDALRTVFDLPAGMFHAVHNGIDREFLVATKPDLFRSRFGIDGPFILNVANIEPRKNQLALVEAMRSFPDHRLVLVGRVRDRDYGARVAAAAGERAIHVGPLDHHSALLRSAYAGCDVFALPSTLETPGLAALEAAAQGARIVVTGEGSAREYFAGHATYVDPASARSIADGISAALGDAPGAAGAPLRAVIEDAFTWDRVVERLANVYDVVVRSAAAPAIVEAAEK
jgi:glycosyltransferase involved in cell wall biosynthesis